VIYRIGRAGERHRGDPEMLLIPKMHASFVADFNLGIQVFEELPRPANYSVFRFVGGVFVKIEQIVVPDAGARVSSVQYVPDGLEQGPRCQPPVPNTQPRRQLKDLLVDRVPLDIGQEESLIIGSHLLIVPQRAQYSRDEHAK